MGISSFNNDDACVMSEIRVGGSTCLKLLKRDISIYYVALAAAESVRTHHSKYILKKSHYKLLLINSYQNIFEQH